MNEKAEIENTEVIRKVVGAEPTDEQNSIDTEVNRKSNNIKAFTMK